MRQSLLAAIACDKRKAFAQGIARDEAIQSYACLHELPRWRSQ